MTDHECVKILDIKLREVESLKKRITELQKELADEREKNQMAHGDERSF